jgi:hypothetical protein
VCCPSGILADRRYVRQVAGQGVRAEVRSDDADLRITSCASIPTSRYRIETKKDEVRWQGVLTALHQLKAVAPVPCRAALHAESSFVSSRIRHPQPVERTGHTSPWPRLLFPHRLVWAIHMT